MSDAANSGAIQKRKAAIAEKNPDELSASLEG
jgi:hypothetical protein